MSTVILPWKGMMKQYFYDLGGFDGLSVYAEGRYAAATLFAQYLGYDDLDDAADKMGFFVTEATYEADEFAENVKLLAKAIVQ